jgi:hypothetical protein
MAKIASLAEFETVFGQQIGLLEWQKPPQNLRNKKANVFVEIILQKYALLDQD